MNMKSFIKEFKEFISKGNVMDMAVGVIIGGAFTAIVTSLVDDIIMPLISLLTGGFDFSNLSIALGSGEGAATDHKDLPSLPVRDKHKGYEMPLLYIGS